MEILNYSPISKNLFTKTSNNPMLDFPNTDILKCGSCSLEFPLSNICVFIEHKIKRSCSAEIHDHHNHHHHDHHSSPASPNSLSCSSCNETFTSAYSLLEHAQYFHKINLFTDHANQKQQDNSTNENMITPKKEEIFIDVTPPSEETETTPNNQNSKNRSTSISLSSTSPAMSSTSSISSNYLSHGSFKEPVENQDHHYQKRHSIGSFDFTKADNNSNNKSTPFRRNSQSVIDQNECTSSSTDSYALNRYETYQGQKNNFFSIQNTKSPKQAPDGHLDDKGIKSNSKINTSTGEEKKKKPKQALFFCEICNASFNQKIHLTKHSAKHTGIKPFKCSECNYSTVERSHLKVHLRVHTGEKPFKCNYCDYATAQSSTLKIHKKRHHGHLEEQSKNKIKHETGTQNDDSLSQQSVDMENIKTENMESKELTSGKTHFDQFNDYSSQNNFNMTHHTDKHGHSLKRQKTNMPEKPKRVTNYFDVTNRLTNKTTLNALIDQNQFSKNERSIDNPNFICNLTGGIKFKKTSSSQSLQPYTINEQTDTENKLLGLANIALEREIN